MSLFLLMLMLGVANWFATTLLVESELFRPVRDWVRNRYEAATGPRSAAVWSKLHYLVGCHMCAGTWVALAMALFANPVMAGGLVGFVLTALVIKGNGHLVLLLSNLGNARIELNRAKATEAMMGALPDLGSLLGGLMDRHESPTGRTHPFPDPPLGDIGRMPKKPKAKFEPFTDEDLAELDAPEPAAWSKPETKF